MNHHEAQKLFIATSGIVLPFRNQKEYPPEMFGQSRLSVYSRFCNSIEINSIFYKLPKPATVVNWSDTVPEGFLFTFKLWKQITHNPGLQYELDDLRKFMAVVNSVGIKKGCILVQLPPSIKKQSFARVSQLLTDVRETAGNGWVLAIEFRDTSWYAPETYELLDNQDFTMVYHDKTRSGSPMPELKSRYRYVRFHGPDGDYKGSYDQGFLCEYAGYIKEWIGVGMTVFVYFNNTVGDAFKNLQTLSRAVADILPASSA